MRLVDLAMIQSALGGGGLRKWLREWTETKSGGVIPSMVQHAIEQDKKAIASKSLVKQRTKRGEGWDGTSTDNRKWK